MQALDWKDAASDADSRRLLRTRSSVDLRQIRRAVGGPNNSSSERADPAAVHPSGTARPGVGHCPRPWRRDVAAFRPTTSPAVYNGKPIALLATDINLHAIIEFVDALKVKSRSSLNGKKAVAVWVEALDGATAAASIIILFAAICSACGGAKRRSKHGRERMKHLFRRRRLSRSHAQCAGDRRVGSGGTI
jgi:hypothetical protein